MSPQLEVGLLGSISALIGSLIGGLVSLLTTHYAAKKKLHHDLLFRDLDRKETLYADLMAEATRTILAAIDEKSVGALDYTMLFSLSGRIRMVASKEVADAATKLASLAMHFPGKDKPEEIKEHAIKTRAAREFFTDIAQRELLELKRRN